MKETSALAVLASALMTGCFSPIGAVIRQASFDLNCPETDVQVIELNFKSFGATGCNRQAAYLGSCNMIGQCMVLGNGRQGATIQADGETGSLAEAPPSGCEYDSHCKGSRVCQAGRCVDSAHKDPSASGTCKRGDSVGCKALCDSGNGASCFNLAKMYEDGDGVSKSIESMVRFYNLACEKGDTSACTNLGNKYEQGTGVAPEPAQAVPLYLRACGLGSSYGCAALAGLYEKGKGVAPDRARASELYEKACKGGNASACVGRDRAAKQ